MKLRSRTWRIDGLPSTAVKETVSEELGSRPEQMDDQWVWRVDGVLTEHRVAVGISDAVVTEVVYGSKVLKAGFLLGLIFALYPLYFLLSLDQMFSTFVQSEFAAGNYDQVRWQVVLLLIGLVSSVLMGESANFSEFKINLDLVGVVEQDSSNPYTAFTLFYISVISLIGGASFFTGSRMVKAGLMVFPVVIGGVYFYHQNSGLGWPVGTLAIPLLGAVLALVPPVVAVVSSWVVSQQELYYQMLSMEVLRDIAGVGLVAFAIVILVGVVFHTSVVIYAGSVIHDSISRREQVVFESAVARISLLLIMVLSNVLSVISAAVLVDVVQYGFTSHWLWLGAVSGDFGYWISEAFQVSREVLASYYALFLVPVLLLIGMWLFSVWEGVRRQLVVARLLNNSEIYSSDVAGEGVRVVVADQGVPDIRVGVSLLRAQKYIVVSRVVVGSLSRRELESVIAHEMYHHRNYDWLANLTAVLFSGFVGGRNSVLVFYDYPRVERAADDYATEEVGEEYLVSALEELELLRLKTAGGRVFWNEVGVEDDRRDSHGMRSYLFKFYELLFGSILIDVSHLSLEERKERLEG